MNQLSRKTYRIRSYRRQTIFIHPPCTVIGYLNLKSQSLPKSCPERHGLPEGQYPRNTYSHRLFRQNFRRRIIFKQKLLTGAEQIRNLVCRLFFFPKFLTNIRLTRVSENFAPLASVIRYPGLSIRESDDCTLTMIGTKRTRKIRFLRI